MFHFRFKALNLDQDKDGMYLEDPPPQSSFFFFFFLLLLLLLLLLLFSRSFTLLQLVELFPNELTSKELYKGSEF